MTIRLQPVDAQATEPREIIRQRNGDYSWADSEWREPVRVWYEPIEDEL